MKVSIYHNPRCSKSRQTLKILEEHNCDITIIEYLKQGVSIDELKYIQKLLNTHPLHFMRTQEARFKELGLSKNDEHTDQEWLEIIHENPILLERPIVLTSQKAIIGRPPEEVLKIIS